jgi:Leucine-rich repeat (LRR) protein
VVSLVVQSEKQLKFLATITDMNSLRVLLFGDDNISAVDSDDGEVPTKYTHYSIDVALLNVARSSSDLAWFNLPFGYASVVPSSTVAHMRQSLSSLRALEFKGCATLTGLNLSGLKQLQYLDLCFCRKLTKLAVGGLVVLQYMNVSDCTDLATVQGLAELTALRLLNLSGTQLTITTLASLSKITDLQQLIMNQCSDFEDLPQLGSLQNLIHLELMVCEQLTTLPELHKLASLRHLNLQGCSGVTNLELTELVSLQYLDLSYCTALAMVDVSGLASLQYLNVNSCENLRTLTGVNTIKALQHLALHACTSLCSELNLTRLIHLQHLELGYCKLKDIQGISAPSLTSLRHLT